VKTEGSQARGVIKDHFWEYQYKNILLVLLQYLHSFTANNFVACCRGLKVEHSFMCIKKMFSKMKLFRRNIKAIYNL
jgi:hypothetical protein